MTYEILGWIETSLIYVPFLGQPLTAATKAYTPFFSDYRVCQEHLLFALQRLDFKSRKSVSVKGEYFKRDEMNDIRVNFIMQLTESPYQNNMKAPRIFSCYSLIL